MTDLEKYKALLESFGVTFTEEPFSYDDAQASHWNPPARQGIQVVIESRLHEKVSGYAGFVCQAEFDLDGNFAQFSIGE